MPTPARVVVLPVETSAMRIEEVLIPEPGPHTVVVRLFASGICHSQLHRIHAPRAVPTVLGHEATGEVVSVGSAVTHVGAGDRVIVTWVPRDRPSAGGRQPEPSSVPLADGTVAASHSSFTWGTHTTVDEQFVVKIPPDTRTDVTAIIGCAVMTGAGAVMHTASVRRRQSVAVFGVGGVGLSAVIAAHLAGADPIIAVDLTDDKLHFAKRFGATIGVNATECDPVERVRELTGGDGPEFAFDCIGVPETMTQILLAARRGRMGERRGGTAVLVGVPTLPVVLDMRELLSFEKRYIGSYGGSCAPERDFPTFLEWGRTGRLDLDALVTRRYRLDEINEATRALGHGEIAGRAILELDHLATG